MSDAVEPFVWDGTWDEEQVARFLPNFLAVYEQVKSGPNLAYNDAFRGRLPGIAGVAGEDRAIYLLQGLKRQREQDARVAELVADGYEHIEELTEIERFAHVVLYPRGRNGGEWAEFRDARLVPEQSARQIEITGPVRAVLPKGRRTHGHLVNGRRVLVLR